MATSADITFRLYLRGDDLLPEEVTRHMGLEPTRTQTRGLPLGSASPPRLSKFGLWVLTREAEDERYLFCDFLRELEAASRRAGQPFLKIKGVEEAWIDIHYLQVLEKEESEIPDCEFYVGTAEIGALHALQLPFVVTFGVVRQ
jgi:hypothetical protein